MGAEQSTLRFLRPSVSSEDHPPITESSRELPHDPGPEYGREGEGTSSRRASRTEDVPHRMNSRPLWNDAQDDEEMHRPCIIDNNDNEGAIEREFISVELQISNCQEESDIQLADSWIDNNSNVPETLEISGLETSNLQPNDIMEEDEVFIIPIL